jgi:hypothetical protein
LNCSSRATPRLLARYASSRGLLAAGACTAASCRRDEKRTVTVAAAKAASKRWRNDFI